MPRAGKKRRPKSKADYDPVAQELERLKREAQGTGPEVPFNPAAEARIGNLIAQSVSNPRKPKQRV